MNKVLSLRGVTHQGQLESTIHHIFPNEEIRKNARKLADVRDSKTGYPMELDFWIPNLKIGFEFQDAYHYVTTWYAQTSMGDIREKDDYKKLFVQKRGETLIQVPCWWDGLPGSLAATIQFERPDLGVDDQIKRSSPIPMNHIHDYFKVLTAVPDIGELMLASFPLPTINFTSSISLENYWWMGEKYDGVRCCWNPIRSQLYSRAGLLIDLHDAFDIKIHKFLDGEIWFGKGSYLESQKIVSSDALADWSYMRIVSFDVPVPFEIPFEDRYTSLLDCVPFNHDFIKIAARIKCIRPQQLTKSLEHLLSQGGEGVLLRKPFSFYETGRSQNLIKLKAARADMEVMVTDVVDDTCVAKMPNDIVVEIPDVPELQLKRGDIVTVSYENFSRRLSLVNPKIVRIRKDVSWKDIVDSFSKEQELNDTSRKVVGFTTKPMGFWTSGNGQNIRTFFEDFAKSRNLDPLVPDSWYPLSAEFLQSKEGRYIVRQFKGGFTEALQQVFPEMVVDKGKFSIIPKHYWSNIGNRQQIFLDYAKQNSFDPRIASNWYKASIADIFERTRSVLNLYRGSVVRALMHLFPDIGLQPYKFDNLPPKYWEYPENRRKFFLDFARDHNFDPLVASNWYSITNELVRATKRSGSLLVHYNGNLKRALFSLFPDIGLVKSKFDVLPSKHWFDLSNRREILIQFAKLSGFDPLIADNWYNASSEKFRSMKHAKSMLQYYKGSLPRAVLHLLPSLNLDKSKFALLPRAYWRDDNNRRDFFIEFAATNKFDPLIPDNWYSISFSHLKKTKYGLTVLRHENRSLPESLVRLFPNIGLDSKKFQYVLKSKKKKMNE